MDWLAILLDQQADRESRRTHADEVEVDILKGVLYARRHAATDDQPRLWLASARADDDPAEVRAAA